MVEKKEIPKSFRNVVEGVELSIHYAYVVPRNVWPFSTFDTHGILKFYISALSRYFIRIEPTLPTKAAIEWKYGGKWWLEVNPSFLEQEYEKWGDYILAFVLAHEGKHVFDGLEFTRWVWKTYRELGFPEKVINYLINLCEDSCINDELLSYCAFPEEFKNYVHEHFITTESIKEHVVKLFIESYKYLFKDEKDYRSFLEKIDSKFEGFRIKSRYGRMATLMDILSQIRLKIQVLPDVPIMIEILGDEMSKRIPYSCPCGRGTPWKSPKPEELPSEDEARREEREAAKRAYEGARRAGYEPGGIVERVKLTDAELEKWPFELEKKLYLGTKIEPTWRGVPRRWLPIVRTLEKIGIIAPRYKPEEVTGKVVFLVDVSGSISSIELSIFLGAVNKIIERVKPREYWLITFDTKVQEVRHFIYPQKLPIEVSITGRGGTCFIPPLKKVIEEIRNVDVVVMFTDMCNFDNREEVRKLIIQGGWKHIWAIPATPTGETCLNEWKESNLLVGEVVKVVPMYKLI